MQISQDERVEGHARRTDDARPTIARLRSEPRRSVVNDRTDITVGSSLFMVRGTWSPGKVFRVNIVPSTRPDRLPAVSL